MEAQKRMDNLTPEKQEHLIKILHAVPLVKNVDWRSVDVFAEKRRHLFFSIKMTPLNRLKMLRMGEEEHC